MVQITALIFFNPCRISKSWSTKFLKTKGNNSSDDFTLLLSAQIYVGNGSGIQRSEVELLWYLSSVLLLSFLNSPFLETKAKELETYYHNYQ